MSVHTCHIHGITWHISSGMCPDCIKESEAAHDEYLEALQDRQDEALFEIHVHADDCAVGSGGECSCLPYVFNGEDERTTEQIIEADKLHHKAN